MNFHCEKLLTNFDETLRRTKHGPGMNVGFIAYYGSSSRIFAVRRQQLISLYLPVGSIVLMRL